VWAFWWPRFERIARWFLAEEAARRGEIAESAAECGGRIVFAAPGGEFTVTARADRIDRLRDGGLVIIDYKTGALPAKADIANLIAVQLPLEGAIAAAGGFAGMAGRPAALEYWKLSGGTPAGERIALDDPEELIARTHAATAALIAAFDDPATPYPCPPVAPRYSDYALLERLGESEAER
jgi:ATP-dependent helicase/nuclease subunit B